MNTLLLNGMPVSGKHDMTNLTPNKQYWAPKNELSNGSPLKKWNFPKNDVFALSVPLTQKKKNR